MKKKKPKKSINSIYALIVFSYYKISSGREILFFKIWVIERSLTVTFDNFEGLYIYIYRYVEKYVSYWSNLAILSCTATLIITDCSGNWQHINMSTKNRIYVCLGFFSRKLTINKIILFNLKLKRVYDKETYIVMRGSRICIYPGEEKQWIFICMPLIIKGSVRARDIYGVAILIHLIVRSLFHLSIRFHIDHSVYLDDLFLNVHV